MTRTIQIVIEKMPKRKFFMQKDIPNAKLQEYYSYQKFDALLSEVTCRNWCQF